RALRAAAEQLDHGMLNEHEGLELPSLENLCLWFAKTLKPAWPGLCRVQVARPTINERCVLSL
ncbi:MAG: 6-carboxytetrahydropterin synthase, partial [Brevundimonas sp.]|uniref:6-pyruvoyl trahydropterin synthase family protein n=2 Tax=Caulobacteraceae TaxID=76892 RepID=UPI003563B987